MIQIKEETIINSSPESIFNFLTQIDVLYKTWHAQDHIFCKTIFGSLSQKGCIFHFLEMIGRFPLYLIAKVTDLRKNEYIEYGAVFPLSFLKLVKGYFFIEKISLEKSRLTAYLGYGDKLGIFDKFANLFVKLDSLKKHIYEEGKNLKNFLEDHQKFEIK